MERQIAYPRIRPTYNKVRDVPLGVDLNEKINAIAPDISIDKIAEPKYCNVLPPAPREQNVSYDPNDRTPCKINFGTEFKKNKCMLAHNPNQNVTGIVCGDPNNDEFARGNEFARGHDLMSKNKYLQETPFYVKKTPTILADNPFYPLPDYEVQQSKDYKTYPHPKQFVNGQPIYKYPYTLKNEQKATGYKEEFENSNSQYKLLGVVGLLIGLSLLI